MTNDPDGRTVPDHKSILANLKNPNYKILDIDGKEITPDDDVRKNLIKTEQTAHTNQDSVWTIIRTEKSIKKHVYETLTNDKKIKQVQLHGMALLEYKLNQF